MATSVQETPMGVRIDIAPDDATLNTNEQDQAAFLRQALERFRWASEATAHNRREGLVDDQIVDGEGVWNPTIRTRREKKFRPCLVIDRARPFISHVANEERQSRPAIQIDPAGDGGDVEDAQIRQGLIRGIELRSNAQTVYDNTFERMLRKGWAWIEVLSEFEDDHSFNQELRITDVMDDYKVYVDPDAKDVTRKDASWGFVAVDLPRGRFINQYGSSRRAANQQLPQGLGDLGAGWVTKDTIRVARYYTVDHIEEDLYQLSDGTGKFKDELGEGEDLAIGEDGKPVTRKSFRRRVKRAVITAGEILEGNKQKTGGQDLKCSAFPLVMISGREEIVAGQRRLSGMIRNNRDAIRMYSYWVSAFTENIALSPKNPFIAAAGQVEAYKQFWDSMNEENWPYLPYDPMDVKGTIVPPPQRNVWEAPVQAMSLAIRQADNDVKAGFSIFDASLGQRGPQESARAILARTNQAEGANMHWLDNMRRSIQQIGEVLLDMIPTRYDTARAVRVVRPNSEQEIIRINELFTDKQGAQKKYDMASGKFACVVTVGKAQSTKRQESVEAMAALSQAAPDLVPRYADVWIGKMDFDGAKEIAARLKPADVQDDAEIPPKVQLMLRQLMQQHEQLVAALNEAQYTIETKTVENEYKLRIAELQEQTKVSTTMAKLNSTESIAWLEQEYARITQDLNRAHEKTLAAQAPAAA